MPALIDETGDSFMVDDFDESPGSEGVTRADARQLVALRHERDQVKALADEAEKAYRAEEERLWEKMENAGDTSVTKEVSIDGETTKVRLVRRGTVYSKVLDTDTLLESLEQEGRSDEMTKPGFEKKRLNEYARECLEQGRPLPEGLDFYERRYIAITES